MAVKTGCAVTKDTVADLLKSVKDLTRSEVLIGIPAANAARQQEPGENSDLTNAEIGYIMEFGAPEKNIPPRPFLIPGVAKIRDEAVSVLRKTAQRTLDGKSAQQEVAKGFTRVGLMGQNAVKAKIAEGPFTPLAESTIQARARRGRKGAQEYLKRKAKGEGDTDLAGLVTPLVDTGGLRDSVTFVVRRKGA